jgi:hypothetical protein
LTATRVKSVVRREETVLHLGGSGDNFHMTWAADDRQLLSVTDGYGWAEDPPGRYASRLWAISGDAQSATFEDFSGYPELLQLPHDPENYCRYLAFGVLAVDGRIYHAHKTLNHPPRVWLDSHAIGAKLIHSPDGGSTWHNQDGSTPVAWEDWYDRSQRNMAFFREPQDAFSSLTFLQMGRDYEHNRDGYVYIYSPNGNYEGWMNELVMLRVPKGSILDRRAYEYFAGLTPGGGARWVKDIDARGVVHTFPAGYVNTARHIVDDLPYAWEPSIVYNAPLGLYLMANWGMSLSPEGTYFAGPSYLGIWTAPEPWGPWEQVHEETAWTPEGDPESLAYAPQIAPKWISEDGRSLWLVWGDAKGVWEYVDAYIRLVEEAKATGATVDERLEAEYLRQRAEMMPFYGFNTQRVDLLMD